MMVRDLGEVFNLDSANIFLEAYYFWTYVSVNQIILC